MNETNENKPPIDLLALPLISQYRVLLFYGTANGGNLNLAFPIEVLQDHPVVIKRVKLIPYAGDATIDFFVSDGTTSNSETLAARMRLTRVIDDFNNGAIINFLINDVPIGIFPSDAAGGYPMDLDIDNIYYYYSEKVQTFNVGVDGDIFEDLEAGSTGQPFIKVLVEVYII